MTEKQAGRPTSASTLFGKIALKNKLVDESQLRDVLSKLEEGGDLGEALVKEGIVSEAHARAIRKKVAEKISEKSADSSAGSAEAAVEVSESAHSPRDGVITADAFAKIDFTSLAGKPLSDYLKRIKELGASDFHFQVDSPPLARIHGILVRMKHPSLTAEDTEKAIRELLDEERWAYLEEHLDLDFCLEGLEHGRYRTNLYKQRKGFEVIFRVIPDTIPTLESLHLPKILEQFTKYNQGIVLVTGPAGCGKSATMAALLDIINEKRKDHVVTVEDPIEYLFESKNCNVNQRHVRRHTASFASALRSAMRADPDVIMVGEMRDLETISMAITAAETGHLVLATLHTTNAVRSIDRLIDVFPPREQEQIRAMVSESMRGVISQQLIPRADGLGREPALEIMIATPAVGNLIREGRTFQLLSVLQTGKKQGMTTMDDSIRKLLNQGVISRERALFHSENPGSFSK